MGQNQYLPRGPTMDLHGRWRGGGQYVSDCCRVCCHKPPRGVGTNAPAAELLVVTKENLGSSLFKTCV